MSDAAGQPFYRTGPERPAVPILLSVPHAGRDYRPELIRSARVDLSVLEMLEDRLVDRLVWRATAAGAPAIIATAPRAEIDLNRDERELDPAMVAPPPRSIGLIVTARLRGGLGLVPSRLGSAGPLWRGRMSREEIERRIESIHRPFHRAIADGLTAAKRHFGAAVLIDCHSMPPRPGPPTIIFGDRHGATIGQELVEAAVETAEGMGFIVGRNDPYAGGHVISRHARPHAGVHALQLEIDRRLYLDEALRAPGDGFDGVTRLIAALAARLGEAVLSSPPQAIAAE